MKTLIRILLTTFISIIFLNLNSAFAIESGFSTRELTQEEYATFVSNVEFVLLKTEPQRTSIMNFAVSENEAIATYHDIGNQKLVCVYSNLGEFQYGYLFETSQECGVEWTSCGLNIYFVRSDIVLSIDEMGRINDIARIENTIENNSYSNELLCNTEYNVNGNRYILRNDMGVLNLLTVSYSQIAVISQDEIENVIYDVNSNQLIKTIVICVFVIVFVIIAIAVLIKTFIVEREKYSGQSY